MTYRGTPSDMADELARLSRIRDTQRFGRREVTQSAQLRPVREVTRLEGRASRRLESEPNSPVCYMRDGVEIAMAFRQGQRILVQTATCASAGLARKAHEYLENSFGPCPKGTAPEVVLKAACDYAEAAWTHASRNRRRSP